MKTTSSGARIYWGEVFDNTSLALRKKSIEKDFIPYVESVFKKQPELRSALFTVAQYWADEAADAVHAKVVFSTRETPLWPHPCFGWDDSEAVKKAKKETQTEYCGSCESGRRSLGWMPFDDNGHSIVAFQSCCREDSSQEDSESTYSPYAIARRSSDGKHIEVEIVGGPIRAWLEDAPVDDELADEDDGENAIPVPKKAPPATSRKKDDEATQKLFDLVFASPDDDGPRAVLADHLMQHNGGDPLGEYITLALSQAKTPLKAKAQARFEELETKHGRNWLGPLASFTSPEYVEWDRGFVKSLAVHLENDKDWKSVSSAREWGGIQNLRFLRNSKQHFSPAMRSLRSVGPLDVKGIAELEKMAGKLEHLESMHVVLSSKKMMGSINELNLPTLRTLIVTTGAGGPGQGGRSKERRNPFTGEMMEVEEASTSQANLSASTLNDLTKASFWKKLDQLVVTSVSHETVVGWLGPNAPKKDGRPKTITFTGATPMNDVCGFRMSVTGDVATIDMPSLNSDIGLTEVATMIRALPNDVLNIDLVDTRFFGFTDDDVTLMKKAAGTSRKVRRS